MRVRESLIRDALRLVVWYPIRWLLALLPFRSGAAILAGMGNLHFRCSRRKSAQLQATLTALGLGGENPQVAVRGYFQNHYLDQLFVLIAPKINRGNLGDLVTLVGLDHLDQARAAGKGVILVHGHFGPAQLPLVILALLGYPMHQLGNPSDEGLSWIGRNVAYRLRMHYEKLMPAEIIAVRKFLRPAFTALAKNGIVMTTGDGSGREEAFGEHFQTIFLGRPYRVPLGPARLAEKTGAALLPLFVVPDPEKMFRIVIGPNIVQAADGRQSPAMLMQCFIDLYEQQVGRNPGYMHFLDRIPAVDEGR